jgi:hypothetical protein
MCVYHQICVASVTFLQMALQAINLYGIDVSSLIFRQLKLHNLMVLEQHLSSSNINHI